MTYELRTTPKVDRYLKKIKEKPLKDLFKQSIRDVIAEPYEVGERKSSDIADYFCCDFRYKGTSYRIAYDIKEEIETVVIVTVGVRENFYEDLKRYIKSSSALKKE